MSAQTNVTLSLQQQHDYMCLISLVHHGDEHPNSSMLCPMFILSSRNHMLQSSNMVDKHVVLQYALSSLIYYADYMLCYILLLHTSP